MSDFTAVEEEVLNYWKKHSIFAVQQKGLLGKQSWSFLDGPITANNPMGVHHAWGRALKDLYQRYHAMRGHDQRFQNGFDCQGLWLEVEAEKSLGLNSGQDIESFGLDKFSRACRARVEKFSKVQTDQSIQLGQWMDWGHDYFTMDDKNIEGIWFFLKKCFEKGMLYKGRKILPWCVRCGTSSSKHEMSDGGYADIVHPSVYVKAKIKGRENEFLLIWTTTEWTLSSNVAAAVNPEIIYVQLKQGDEIYYIAEAAMSKVRGETVVLDHVKGSELVGLEYESFYPDIAVQQDIVHKVIAWNEVGEEEGTGIVHIAPSCGEEDHELGKELGLALLPSALDTTGNYTEGFGWLTGKYVRDVKKYIVEDLKKRGLLLRVEDYLHRYPICWRCKEELVYRLDTAWFLACDDIRPKMKEESVKVEWYPSHVGKLMQDWLDNMGDWNISRKRYWGLPLMFYECEACDKIEVIGSRKELKEKAVDPALVDALPELHRPWIDKIKIKCGCGAELSRVPDVGDCWLDAGIVPYTTLKYFEDKAYWKKWFPAQLEIEMRAQVRLWFYSQLFMSVVLEGVAPYKKILAYEEVRDEKGKPMHKSSGNAIWFDDAVKKMGADVMRWQYCQQNPQYNVSFGYGPAEVIKRDLRIIQNLGTYVLQNCAGMGKEYASDYASRWILSRKEHLVAQVTASLDALEYHKAFAAVRDYFLFDVSKTYVQFVREQLDDPAVKRVLLDCYLEGMKLLAPFLPFTAEKTHMDLKEAFGFATMSIHLYPWPQSNTKRIDVQLEKDMKMVQEIMQAALAAREKAHLGIRWPLAKLTVVSADRPVGKALQVMEGLILRHLNVKGIDVIPQLEGAELIVTPNGNTIGKAYKQDSVKILKALDEATLQKLAQQGSLDVAGFALTSEHVYIKETLPEGVVGSSFSKGVVYIDTHLAPALEAEGYAREVMRRVQDLRKTAGMVKEDRITLSIVGDYDISDHRVAIQEKVGAKALVFEKKTLAHVETFTIKGKKFVVSLEQV